MKSLLILRHAKTQSDAPAGDHARELTERGHRNAETMGAYIKNLTGTPDLIITSDATRARQTAEIVASAGNRDQGIRLPTSGLALLEFNVDRWGAVGAGAGRLRGVATPRTIA